MATICFSVIKLCCLCKASWHAKADIDPNEYTEPQILYSVHIHSKEPVLLPSCDQPSGEYERRPGRPCHWEPSTSLQHLLCAKMLNLSPCFIKRRDLKMYEELILYFHAHSSLADEMSVHYSNSTASVQQTQYLLYGQWSLQIRYFSHAIFRCVCMI
jgi:hypothetical protein